MKEYNTSNQPQTCACEPEAAYATLSPTHHAIPRSKKKESDRMSVDEYFDELHRMIDEYYDSI